MTLSPTRESFQTDQNQQRMIATEKGLNQFSPNSDIVANNQARMAIIIITIKLIHFKMFSKSFKVTTSIYLSSIIYLWYFQMGRNSYKNP